MNVLVISHMYPSIVRQVAGIFVHEQVRALVEKGIKVQVVSPVPWTPFPVSHLTSKWRGYASVPSRAVWEGVPVWYPRCITFPRSWFFASSGWWMYWGIKNVARMIRDRSAFDLIHAHVALPDGFAGALLATDLKVPLVVTIHGQDAYVTIDRSKACRTAVERVFRSADEIIAVSRKLKQTLFHKLGGQFQHKMRVIGNGVSLDKVALGDQLERPTSVQGGQTRLLTVGYCIERKGHAQVLLAIAELVKRGRTVRYIVVGDGPERERLERLTQRLGLEGSVRFVGLMSHRNVMAQMSECDVFVLPSWNEAFGVAYVEAMAHGKPVIGCRGEGIEDFIEHGKTGMLVKPRDVDSLVEALDFVLSHPEEARAMGQRARRLVVENYTWETNAEKTIAVYEDVLRRTGRQCHAR